MFPLPIFSFQPKGFVEVKPDKTHGFILTRRQFLAFSATAAAVVALVPLAGCGGGTATSKSSATCKPNEVEYSPFPSATTSTASGSG